MFRLTRSLLWRSKDLSNTQCLFRTASSKQSIVELGGTKTQICDLNETSDKDENPLSEANKYGVNEHYVKSMEHRAYQSHIDRILNPLELSKLFSDEQASQLTNAVAPVKAIQVMKFLSTTKSRPIKLLMALSDKISHSQQQLNLKQCSDLMFCLGVFCLKNQELLDKIAVDIIANKDKFTSGILPAALLSSCGVLKYRNSQLIDVLLEQLISPAHEKRSKSLLSALKTLAAINYFPDTGKLIMDELLKCSLTDFSHTKSFLDFVWSSVILNHYSEEHMSAVLSESFVNQMEVAEGVFGQAEPVNMKLLNINAAANYFLPSYQGPRLQNITCKNLSSKSKALFAVSVIDGLSHIFPKNGYLQLNVDTNAGFAVDIECYMDSKCNPVLIAKKKDNQKIAIMLLQFNDFCLSSEQTECGLTVFKEKVLKAMGYKVVKVIFSEFNMHSKLYEKVHYLQKKLEEACKI